MSSIKQTVIVLLCVIALIVGMMVARVVRSPEISTEQLQQLGAIVKQQSTKLADFSLIDHQGRTFDNRRLQGKWSLVFFGYTYCPDVCPTTMALLSQLEQELQGSIAEDNTQYILASVDPERDTPEKLAEYVTHFNTDFIGVTGEVASMFEFARNLNSMFAKAPIDDSGSYLVDHSMSIAIINPAGEHHGFLRGPHNVANMNQALRAIMGNYR
ncbi:MAG: SCO family protein [Pseudomonadales bacterium]|nr:SCO family protein [Pseudomonadales bacterium]MCP5216320.1 SCO family protein [Pseudomonadales bacterium]